MKPRSLLLSAALAAAIPAITHAQTGWINTTWADRINNAHDFYNVDNWDQQNVSGEFGVGLGTAKVTQYIKFGQDWTNAFSFTHSNEANLTFVGDGTRNATWFVPGDMVFSSSATKGTITFGNETNGRKFLLDLGGEKRTFVLQGTAGYVFVNAITNGDVEIESTTSVSLKYTDASIDGNVDFYGPKLQFDSSKSGEAGTERTPNLVFRGQELEVKGNNTVHADDSIGETLTVDGSRGALKLLSIIAGNAGASLTAGAFSITNGALLGVRGAGLGGTPGAGAANVFFRTAPEIIGGTGGTECPVIPGVIAAPTYGTTSILGYAYDTSLATYDAATGVRPLDFSTEYVTSTEAVVSGRENLLVGHGTSVVVSGDVTVNSVALQGGDGGTASTLTGAEGAVLHVTSGQVLVGYHRNNTPAVSVPVDFGNRQGCVSYASGKNTTWSAPISGNRGVALTWFNTATNQSAGITMSGNCTYVGNTFVNGTVFIGTNVKVLPCGERTGDVYVRGVLGFNGSSKGTDKVHPVINGLYGNGTIKRASYNVDLDIGDRNANGDFDGTVTDFNNVYKIGTGSQRFGGTIACNNSFNVTNGTVILDGSVAQGAVNVASGAAIGGSGTISTSLAFASGSSFAVAAADGTVPCLTVNGAVTGSAGVVVSGELRDGTEARILRSDSPIAATFTATSSGIRLEKRANDTELWVVKPDSATVIVFR